VRLDTGLREGDCAFAGARSGGEDYAARRWLLGRRLLAQASGVISLTCQFGHRRQPGEDFAQVGEGINAAPPAAFDDGVDGGAALPGLRCLR